MQIISSLPFVMYRYTHIAHYQNHKHDVFVFFPPTIWTREPIIIIITKIVMKSTIIKTPCTAF